VVTDAGRLAVAEREEQMAPQRHAA